MTKCNVTVFYNDVTDRRATSSARAGGAGVDSRYTNWRKHKEPQVKVHHLNCGTMRPFGGRLIDGTGGIRRRAEMACHCLLLETDVGLVLVDTGMGSPSVHHANDWLGRAFVNFVGPVRRQQDTALAKVRQLGYAAEDVRHIVLTHLDLDHAGGLIDFPQATVHVYDRELQALKSPRDMGERLRYRKIQFRHGPLWSSYDTRGEPWFGFGAVRDLDGLPPEILLVPLAGHTRGHAGVAVDSGDGWLLHAGDAYFFHSQLNPRHPHCPPGLKAFELGMQAQRGPRVANQRRLRELVATHSEVNVFSAHSSVELHRLQRSLV